MTFCGKTDFFIFLFQKPQGLTYTVFGAITSVNWTLLLIDSQEQVVTGYVWIIDSYSYR